MLFVIMFIMLFVIMFIVLFVIMFIVLFVIMFIMIIMIIMAMIIKHTAFTEFYFLQIVSVGKFYSCCALGNVFNRRRQKCL